MPTAVRSLMLASSLLLVLPPGWCCLLPRAAAPKNELPPCCRPCCDGAKHSEPVTPAPLPPGRCPCSDRQSIAPDVAKLVLAVPFLTAPAPALDLAVSPVAVDDLLLASGPSLDLSLHLVHCVWLC